MVNCRADGRLTLQARADCTSSVNLENEAQTGCSENMYRIFCTTQNHVPTSSPRMISGYHSTQFQRIGWLSGLRNISEHLGTAV